jgi:hypothetical protein
VILVGAHVIHLLEAQRDEHAELVWPVVSLDFVEGNDRKALK